MAQKSSSGTSESGSGLLGKRKSSRNRKTDSKQNPWRRSPWVKAGLLIVILILTALMFPRSEAVEYNYQVNEITNEPVIAPFTFPVLKSEEELAEDRREARQNVPYVFKRKQTVADSQLNQLDNFFTDLDQMRKVYQRYQNSLSDLSGTESPQDFETQQNTVQNDSLAFISLVESFNSAYGVDLRKEKWNVLLTTTAPDGSDRLVPYLQPILKRILTDQFAEGLYDIPIENISSSRVAIQSQGEEVIEDASAHNDRNKAWINAKRQIRSALGEENQRLVSAAFEVIVHFLEPNLIYQKEVTERRQEEAISRVPISKGIVLENEKIVDANTRVTPGIQRKLSSLATAKSKRGGEQGVVSKVYTYTGRLLFVAIILFFFVAFLLTYRPEIYEDNKHVFLIALIFILFTTLSYFIYYQWGLSEYIIPITIAAMLFTIIYDARVSFFGTITLTVLISVLLGNRMNFFITTIFASTLAIYAVRRLRTRNQLYYAILYITGAYYLALFATELTLVPDLRHLGSNFLWAAGNGILSPLLTYGLIALIEMSFKITTDMTLLEMSDLNRPLLKQLAMKAPGTYHHCVVVGNLAEAAAEAIGANSLLARVGAYYHDIGKMNKPKYFVENQRGGENKHDNLKPQLSALIIQAHVKEGLELAREYNLPKEVEDFIPMHHGTMKIEYFYQKALEQAAETGEEVNEADFRHEGPKPNTKETGIVMLCEAIEAGTRSIKNPTPQKFHQFIDMMFDKRLKDGQLDDCPLTIKELSEIRDAFIPILFGMYHLRIEYPDQQKSRTEQKEWRKNLKATKA
ncbi:MAG: Cyclic-di-AMP phosphodiesterase PgpH [Candidatus Marinimicrobia bacterium]|nr:Cyclic-di-AMP phosphodiesterase PgpH [Candidatus Neomarinimicrobiota bacterium]